MSFELNCIHWKSKTTGSETNTMEYFIFCCLLCLAYACEAPFIKRDNRRLYNLTDCSICRIL